MRRPDRKMPVSKPESIEVLDFTEEPVKLMSKFELKPGPAKPTMIFSKPTMQKPEFEFEFDLKPMPIKDTEILGFINKYLKTTPKDEIQKFIRARPKRVQSDLLKLFMEHDYDLEQIEMAAGILEDLSAVDIYIDTLSAKHQTIARELLSEAKYSLADLKDAVNSREFISLQPKDVQRYLHKLHKDQKYNLEGLKTASKLPASKLYIATLTDREKRVASFLLSRTGKGEYNLRTLEDAVHTVSGFDKKYGEDYFGAC